MKRLLEHYKERNEIAEKKLKSLSATINTLVLLRVLVFTSGITLSIWLSSIAWLSVLIGVITIVIFGFLIKRHLTRNEERRYWQEINKFYQNEILGLNGDWSFANTGEEYHQHDHEFAHDIDLFGERSFFQRVNRASLKGGEQLLAKMFLSNDTSRIIELQDANRELRNKPTLIENFIGFARMNESEVSPEVVKKWMIGFKAFIPKFAGIIAIVFSILSVGVIAAFGMDQVSGFFLSGWLIAGLGIVGIWLRSITKFNNEVNKIVSSIKSYGKLLKLFEEENFESSALKDLKQKIVHTNGSASVIIGELSKSIDLFNNRNNLIVALLGNGFFVWDIHTSRRLQKWMLNHSMEVLDWLDVLYEFDALISLAIYSNNHPEYVYPSIDESTNLEGKAMGHPLIPKGQCVVNDVKIDHSNFLIITGANMAGKSTFLRTISLSILMTNLGLPVFADELKIRPQKLITSMRSSDSLLEDESYFFAELKRLKYIIESVQNENYFIVLDEILKGTNSKDKEEGSKKFVRRLVEMKTTGIIATHDLGLCTIEKELPQVHNFYFDAEIINDELHFDYKMKTGICKNMNASFLLRKMNIVKE